MMIPQRVLTMTFLMIDSISHAGATMREEYLRHYSEHPFPDLPYTSSRMLRRDLERAGIPHKTDDGVVDMHALRHTCISSLIARGVDPKTVQVLARHSTITLTIDRYSHTDDARKREALEGPSRYKINSRTL